MEYVLTLDLKRLKPLGLVHLQWAILRSSLLQFKPETIDLFNVDNPQQATSFVLINIHKTINPQLNGFNIININ